MSLQVWLPLTKDLRQQGLSNVTVTNNGATFNSAGKLGGCYSFDGIDDAIGVGNLSTIVDTDFSWSCWFYRSEWSSKSWETIFGGPSGFELETKSSSTNSPLMYAYSWGKGTFTYELNQWNHLVMTRTTSETKFYLNGELKLTGSAGSIPSGNYFVGSWSSTTGQNFKGKVNDVRIYDHCLSPMEVKELAKGLVLHYPLSDNSNQQMNNCWSTPTFETSAASGGSNHWAASGANGTQGQSTDKNYIYNSSQTYAHWVANASTATGNYLFYQSPAFEGGYRSFQCICKEENSIEITNNICYAVWNARSGGVANNSWTSIVPLGNGFYWCKCEGIMQDGSNDLVGIYIKPGYKVYFTFCYLENDRTVCSNPFYYSNIIYDSSGFCNNGTISGALTISNDTPKYTVSTQFTGTQFITADSPTFEGATLALWAKTTSTSNAALVIDYKSKLGFGFWGGVIIPSCNSNIKTTYPATNYYVNQWNHIVVVRNGSSSIQLYINGTLQTTTASTQDYWSGGVIDGLSIAARPNGSSPVSCQVSDIRIYATALSADDVKSLYQNSAYIDSNGNVYGAIHSEG